MQKPNNPEGQHPDMLPLGESDPEFHRLINLSNVLLSALQHLNSFAEWDQVRSCPDHYRHELYFMGGDLRNAVRLVALSIEAAQSNGLEAEKGNKS